MTKCAIFLPDYGFDPTEAATPFKYLSEKGWNIDIITEHGKVPECDQKMLQGLLANLGLGAKQPAKDAYEAMIRSPAFASSAIRSWSNSNPNSSGGTDSNYPSKSTSTSFSIMDYDVIVLPGGHDKGVRQIIESESLRAHLDEFFPHTKTNGGPGGTKKVCAAICHGVLVLAWSKDGNGKSILYNRKTTTLPEHLERLAHAVSVPLGYGDYYRTYPGKYTAELVQKELKSPDQYIPGPLNLTGSYSRGSSHIVKDEYYVSARWPGDAIVWSETIYEVAKEAGLA